MRRILLAIAVASLLAGCEGAMEKKLREDMHDPAAAQFKDKVTYKDWACISVNGKNAYGGYVGFKRHTMKNVVGDYWETVSTEEACTEQILVATEKREREMDVADNKAGEIPAAQVYAAMKEAKLMPAAGKDYYAITDPACRKAAEHAIMPGQMAVSIRYATNRDSFKAEFAKRLEALMKGDCQPPAGYKNEGY